MIHKIKKDLLRNFKDINRIDNLKNFMNFRLEIKNYFGIGNSLINIFFRMLGFSNLKGIIHKFSYNVIVLLENFIRKNFIIGDLYKRKLNSQYTRYMKIKSYRGFRFSNKLPARGQRTRVNSRTSRKFKIIVVSNKFSKDIFILKQNYIKKFLDKDKINNEKNIL
jgi:ribosomal protein S13